MPKNNYKVGALKRRFKISGDKPGDFISKVNEMKISSKRPISKTRLSIMGLV